MIALLALGVVLAVVGCMAVADEWRRSGTQNARINKEGLRLEVVTIGAVVIGVGVAVGYVAVS